MSLVSESPSKKTYRVLITTSGVGSRLGELTENTNKSLVLVGDKPAICHIVDSYPTETEFVVTLGHFGDHVEQFLGLKYPDRLFHFVSVQPYFGQGSSLGFSMFQAKKYLQCPFIYHACDSLIISEVLPSPEDTNWVGGSRAEHATNYASFDHVDNFVTKFHDKGALYFDFLHIGVIGISDFALFWDLLEIILRRDPQNNQITDVDVLREMIEVGARLKSIEFKGWQDIGNSDALRRAVENNPTKTVILPKNDQFISIDKGNVIKFFADASICQNRVKRAENLGDLVPSVLAKRKNFLVYEFVEGENLSTIKDPSKIEIFLNWSDKYLWKKQVPESHDDMLRVCDAFYVEKTKARIKEFQKTRGIVDSPVTINGTKIPSLASSLLESFEIVLNDIRPTTFHGDLVLDNIIYSERQFKLIDWRQDFGGSLFWGDQYYDLAKLFHSFYVNHDIIVRNLFEIKQEGHEVSVGILMKDNLVGMRDIYQEWISNHNLNQSKINVLTSIIWINMAPLHHHPFDIFLFYFGRLKLHHALMERL